MSQKGVFKAWVPNWLSITVLFFCLLHCMVLLGVYTSNVTYSASFLDVEVEDLQFSLCVTYGTFLATLLVESRLFKYFPAKNYFLVIFSLSAITFVLSGYTKNFALFIVLRAAEGVLMALPWLPMRQLLISRFTSRNATIIGFSFTYAALLLASPFVMNLAVYLLDNYDWKYMAWGSALFQVVCVALILATFKSHRIHKKIPLYQLDWASFVLVHATILSGAFVFIYGEKKYWFQSAQIVWATVIFLLFGALFFMRQITIKRPAFDLSVFKYPNLRIGVYLFIILYIARATLNICHSSMLTIWGWEPTRVAGVQFINVAGNALGMLFAGICLAQKVASRTIFITGFLLLAVHHLWMTFLFVPDLALPDLAPAYILQGFAVGFLFVPLVLFTVSSVPGKLAPFSGTSGVMGRFWGSTIGFCIMQNAQVYLTQKHFQKLIISALPESPQTQERLAAGVQKFASKGYADDAAYTLSLKSLAQSARTQAVLLTNMEIFTVTGYVLLGVVVLLIFNRQVRKSFDVFKNKVWGS
ncbi:MFS transporter [Flavobacterium akiainvivens]|uniref:MFS transporter n=1 Tax=Flavobacterium akiainvivens TaxID=1202724 RepID=A0A0M9VJH9_9FLAO|nr:MFS transporter [Flavobacterium akiainvivens]KOS07482.1 MFS transporter [Flavobacterium akiainvivens]SFQ63475.1 MFS transporter, DHA2 family, multidrug resistance protein [Flavobacterium akiainvivens]